jgi:hypothetical protein
MYTISQDDYNSKMARAIASQPIRKTVPLASVEIVDSETIRLDGNRISMDQRAFSQLARILGVPVTFQQRVTKLFNEEAISSIVNKMKEAMAIRGVTTVCLVASPRDKKIVSVIKNESSMISNVAFFESIESVISDHNLSVRDFTIDFDGGVHINTVAPNSGWELMGFKDEHFQGGMAFFNSPSGGFQISPYINRLSCLNGVVAMKFSETHKVKSINPLALGEFYDNMDLFARRGFKPGSFDNRIELSMNTMASYAELEAAAELITETSGLERKDIAKWNSISETSATYERHGMSPMLMSEEQKKNAKTGTPVWDVINGLTHFATHDNGIIVPEFSRRKVQIEAGNLFSSKYDMENLVSSPY